MSGGVSWIYIPIQDKGDFLVLDANANPRTCLALMITNIIHFSFDFGQLPNTLTTMQPQTMMLLPPCFTILLNTQLLGVSHVTSNTTLNHQPHNVDFTFICECDFPLLLLHPIHIVNSLTKNAWMPWPSLILRLLCSSIMFNGATNCWWCCF